MYLWPRLLFGVQNFCKNWNVVPYSYYDGKVLISDRWRSYETRKLKKCVFSIFFKSTLVVHFNEHVQNALKLVIVKRENFQQICTRFSRRTTKGRIIIISYSAKTMRLETKEVHNEKDILWLILPFGKNLKTEIGCYFLNLIGKNFPPRHKFHKLFNRNNEKISCSTVPNMKSAINVHKKSH